MGSLTDYLPATGQSDVWRYSNTGDTFEIENIGDPQSIQYFYVGPSEGAEGSRTIEAGLNVHPDSSGSAGLLYGLNEDRTVYHMFTLDANGMVAMFRRDSSGFRLMIEQSSDAYKPGKINILTLQESGDEVSYSLNGTSLGSIGGDLFGKGAVGLGAVGDVRAFYNYFSDGQSSDQSNLQIQEQPQQSTKSALTEETVHVRPIQIVDTQGPAGQMVAYQTFIPEGWVTNGGVQWSHADGPQGCFTGARLIWGAGTADEKYGVAFLDPMSWGMSTIGPSRYMCLPLDMTDAETAMRAYFDAISSALQVSITDVLRPAEIQPLIEATARANQTNLPNVKTWADGVVITARVKSATQENDAYFLVITKHIENHIDANHVFRDGRTALVLGVFTPVGELEVGHPGFAAIFNNLRVNPRWQQVEAEWWRQKLKSSGGGSGGATPTSSDTSVGDMMFESWKKREGMRDAGHSKSINGIWEVQPWQTPSGSTVLLNQNYNHAWQLQNGSIVLTNNANFNPMQSLNEIGQEMRRSN